jgi:hypothetical protein
MAAPQRELVALDHHKLAMHPIGHINPPCIRITRFVPPRWPAAAVQNSAVATPLGCGKEPGDNYGQESPRPICGRSGCSARAL